MEGGLLATGMRSLLRTRPAWRREGTVAAVVCAVAFGHFVTPAGLHEWHWLHILLQKLFYLPILMAAAWFGLRGTLLTAGAVRSVLCAEHVRHLGGASPLPNLMEVKG